MTNPIMRLKNRHKTVIVFSSFAFLPALIFYNLLEDKAIVNKELQEKKTTRTISPVKVQVTVQTAPQTEKLQEEESTKEEKIEEQPRKLVTIEEKIIQEDISTQEETNIRLDNSNISQRKQNFKDLLLPAIHKVHADLMQQYEIAKKLIENKTDDATIQELIKKYRASNEQDLLAKLKPHPKSITIAQSAMQSGWATSRFAQEANNLFGMRSFYISDSRVLANETQNNETIYFKKYSSIEESVQDYYKILALSPKFEDFRQLRLKTDDSKILIEQLDKYYLNNKNYSEVLNDIIQYNEFTKYDK